MKARKDEEPKQTRRSHRYAVPSPNPDDVVSDGRYWANVRRQPRVNHERVELDDQEEFIGKL